MENNQTQTANKKKRTGLWLGLGTLAIGGLSFLGYKLFTKPKNNTSDDDLKETMDEAVQSHHTNTDHTVVHSLVHSVHARASFPLKFGAKGDTVLQLQRALIKSYGAGILKKYGADGYFGRELESALKSKGYQIPLSETDFKKITEEKKETSTNSSTSQTLIKLFNPEAIAKAIYGAILIKDFKSGITLLKAIKNTTDYSLVSEQLKA